MNVFCDTTVLVAASLQAHVHHTPAKAALERISRADDAGFTSGHCLAETFSVLSRMPTAPKLKPQDVLAILETNIIPHFTLLVLAPADYPASRTRSGRERTGRWTDLRPAAFGSRAETDLGPNLHVQ